LKVRKEEEKSVYDFRWRNGYSPIVREKEKKKKKKKRVRRALTDQKWDVLREDAEAHKEKKKDLPIPRGVFMGRAGKKIAISA